MVSVQDANLLIRHVRVRHQDLALAVLQVERRVRTQAHAKKQTQHQRLAHFPHAHHSVVLLMHHAEALVGAVVSVDRERVSTSTFQDSSIKLL